MNAITAHATRSGKWWAVTVPIPGQGDQMTQGRTLDEAQEMANDVVAIWADELDSDDLRATEVILAIDGTPAKLAEDVHRAQAEARAARERAAELQTSAIREMREQGMTMSDIARVMGLSKGRISQLAKA